MPRRFFNRRLLAVLPSLLLLLLFQQGKSPYCHALDRANNRYSFSLTTFDPSGKLGQVERAMEAASLGPPLLGVITRTGVALLAAPQILPSSLVKEDGTPRFTRITTEISVAHSGLSADGRAILDEAQRMAVEHEFLYDQDIPIEILLEEISLLFQEYTMTVGTRPFGTTLLVAFTPRDADRGVACLYRIDPSGAVTTVGDCALVHISKDQVGMVRAELRDLQKYDNPSKAEAALATILRNTLTEVSKKLHGGEDTRLIMKRTSILTIQSSCHNQLQVKKHAEPQWF